MLYLDPRLPKGGGWLPSCKDFFHPKCCFCQQMAAADSEITLCGHFSEFFNHPTLGYGRLSNLGVGGGCHLVAFVFSSIAKIVLLCT